MNREAARSIAALSEDDAYALRRISMTLRRWFEAEYGTALCLHVRRTKEEADLKGGEPPMPTTGGNARTCLDCKVLPPFSVLLCPLHTEAENMLTALKALTSDNAKLLGSSLGDIDAARAIIAKAEGR